MALPVNNPLYDRYYFAYQADIGSALTTTFVIANKGKIIQMYGVSHIANATTTTNVTGNINGTAITGGVLNWTTSQAADIASSATPTGANVVAAGDIITLVSDGGSSSVMPTMFTIIVRETSV